MAPAPALADEWFQPAVRLVHLPLGGDKFITTNYAFAANLFGDSVIAHAGETQLRP